jgi:hypothetical protein
MESREGFIPDVLLVDYADLMKVDSVNYRQDLGRVYKELRGIAVERNIGVVTASQANRSGIRAKTVRDYHIGEDISKIATCDAHITYSQTGQERGLGLARLFVANGRNDEDQFTVLISQAYTLGQFCLDSVRMTSNYWTLPKQEAGEEEAEEGVDE